MGAVTTCSLARGLGGASTGAAMATGAGGAAAIGMGAWVANAPVGIRLMRTASSPSLISISAIPDSSRSSISFLTLRISMPRLLPLKYGVLVARVLRVAGRGARQQPRDRPYR